MPLNAKQKKIVTYGGIGVLAVAGAVGVYEALKGKSAGTPTQTGGTQQSSLQITSVTLSVQ